MSTTEIELLEKKDHANFRRKFNKCMDENDEMLLGNVSTEHIIGVFKAQGRWAGVSRYICYENGKFFGANRTFGR